MAPRTPWTKTSKNSHWKLAPFSFNASPMTEDRSGVQNRWPIPDGHGTGTAAARHRAGPFTHDSVSSSLQPTCDIAGVILQSWSYVRAEERTQHSIQLHPTSYRQLRGQAYWWAHILRDPAACCQTTQHARKPNVLHQWQRVAKVHWSRRIRVWTALFLVCV